MRKVFNTLDKVEELILILLMTIMTVSIVIQVFSRTILSISLSWTEEISRFILVWVTYVGASLGVKRGAHIGVEAFSMLLPKKVRQFVEYIVLVLCIIFTFVVFKESLVILQTQMFTGQKSAAIELPMWIPYLGVTVGTFLMTLRFIEQFYYQIRDNKLGGKI